MKNEIKTQNRKFICTAYILAAGSLWGTMGLFVRGLSNDGLTSVEISTVRSIGAALIMGIILAIKDKSLLRIRLKDIWCFIGTGLVSLTLFNVCYFTTIQQTSMAVAAILLYTSPVFIVILSAFLFRERITGTKIIALIVALVGIALVTGVISIGQNGLVSGAGDTGIAFQTIMIGLISGLGYALYSIFGRYALERNYSSETISFYTFFFSALGLIACTLILGKENARAAKALFGTIPELLAKIALGRTFIDILLVIGISVFVTILPYLFYTKGLSGIDNGKAGIMASIEPVVAALLGMLVYGEVLSIPSYIGIALVLVAIMLL